MTLGIAELQNWWLAVFMTTNSGAPNLLDTTQLTAEVFTNTTHSCAVNCHPVFSIVTTTNCEIFYVICSLVESYHRLKETCCLHF